MRAHRLRWAVSAALAAALALAALAPAGTLAGPSAGTAADASPAPSPTSTPVPDWCPDLSWAQNVDRHVGVEVIVALGPAKTRECLAAYGTGWFTIDAYFPPESHRCDGCGGVPEATIEPAWLSGGPVRVDATTGRVTSSPLMGAHGMLVSSRPSPAEMAPAEWVTPAEVDAFYANDTLALRLPPSQGTCSIDDTDADACSLHQFVGTWLRIIVHYPTADASPDPAAACRATVHDDATITDAQAIAFCRDQLVVDRITVTTLGVCPTSPYTAGELSRFSSTQLAACFGSRTISFVGRVPAPIDGGIGDYWTGTPAWLVNQFLQGLDVESPAGSFLVRVPPRLGACHQTSGEASCPFHPYVGRWVRITGHFMDPASETCRATWNSPAPRPATFTAGFIRQYCREQFVLSAKPTLTKTPANP